MVAWLKREPKKNIRPRANNILHDMNPQPTVEAYERIMNKAPAGLLARWLLRKVRIKEGKVLDIACGPGHLLCALARIAPQLELHGLDASPNMLKAAERRLEKRGLQEKVSLHLGSAYDLPFEDNTFDLVTNTLAIHCFEEPHNFLREFVRVMKPGGKGFILAYKRDCPRWVRLVGDLHTKYRDWKKIPLDGIGAVFDASYTVEEIESLLRLLSLQKWEIKELLGCVLRISIEK